jgi:urea transport system permease protein
MHVDQLVSQILTTMTQISVLAIAALGLGVIFGLMRVINLAHGEFIMAGSYAALEATNHHVPFALVVPTAFVIVGAFGMVIERIIIRPLYGRLLHTMLATWGLSLVLVQIAVNIYGPVTANIPAPLGSMRIGAYSVSQYSLVLIVVAIVIFAATYLLFTKTHYGILAMASVQNPDMASSLGVDAARINMVTFGLGSGLAGLAGAILAPLYSINPSLGTNFTAQTFMTVVVAGPLILSGTALSATLLGATQNIIAYLTTSVWGETALLVISIVLLRFFRLGLSSGWRRQL